MRFGDKRRAEQALEYPVEDEEHSSDVGAPCIRKIHFSLLYGDHFRNLIIIIPINSHRLKKSCDVLLKKKRMSPVLPSSSGH